MQTNNSCFLRVTQASLCSVVLIALITYASSFFYEQSWTHLPQFGFIRRSHRKFIQFHQETSCPKQNATLSNTTVANRYEIGHLNDLEGFSKICSDNGRSVQLLMLIQSAPSHFNHREAIRNTWGRKAPGVAFAFLLGHSQDRDMEDRLTVENVLFGDLLRGHWLDSYNNLTLKSVSMLEWTWKYCSKAKFLLKADDDTFINVPKLLELVDAQTNATRSIFGKLQANGFVFRDRSSKWYVSREEYALERYPAFVTGPAYLLTVDAIQDLYCEALRMHFFRLEDVFLTGFVAKQIKLGVFGNEAFVNMRIEPNNVGHCKLKSLISLHYMEPAEQYELWKQQHQTSIHC